MRAVSKYIFPACLAMAPGVLLLAFTMRLTPHMMWDSVQYLAAATSFATNGTFTATLAELPDAQLDAAGRLITSHPLILWPPGYSLLIGALARGFALDVRTAAALISLASLAIVLWCTWRIACEVTDTTTAAGAVAFIGVQSVVQQLFRSALSEPLFLACGAWTLLSIVRAWADPSRRVRWTVSAALAAGLSMNVRYTGALVLLFQSAAALCLLVIGRSQRERIGLAISIALGPLVGSLFLIHRWFTLGCALCEAR
ncbi:MAG: glycosyltransferase family 39 protein, partial [Acidobacteriaceae bacterium]|nr:glycosyltransferase family 39 protein [Acidobacteriaceae bacterium]